VSVYDNLYDSRGRLTPTHGATISSNTDQDAYEHLPASDAVVVTQWDQHGFERDILPSADQKN